MPDVFMSYVEEDSAMAEEIAQGLERAGFTTWYYERDSLFGVDWLDQVSRQIEECRAVVLLISQHSLVSDQVMVEVSWARTKAKRFVPVLLNVGHEDIERYRVQWAMAFGNVVAPRIGNEGVSNGFVSRLVAGLNSLDIQPSHTQPPDPLEERLAAARSLLNDPERWAEAEAALVQVADDFPESARARQYLGEYYNRSFRNADAVTAFEQAVALQPRNALLHWNLGLALQRGGRTEAAVASLRNAADLGLDPTRERYTKTLMTRLGGDPPG
jgi:tetratricopeptide (TPR) repeat protein